MNRRDWRNNKSRPMTYNIKECLICSGPSGNCNCYNLLALSFGVPLPGSLTPIPGRIEVGESFQFRDVPLEIIDIVLHHENYKKPYIIPGPQANQITLYRDQMNIIFIKKQFKYKFSY